MQTDGWTDSNANMRELRRWRGYCVEWAQRGQYLLSRRNSLFTAEGLDTTPVFHANVPVSPWKRLASSPRLFQRTLRHMFYNVRPLGDGSLFVTFGKQMGVICGGEYRAIRGLRRPTRVLRDGCATDDDGCLYFGEYVDNPNRGAVAIYRLAPGADQLEVANELPAGSVRHIHAIARDPLSGDLWLTTGDLDEESQILRSSDGFRTMDVVGAGDESWRCVSLQFTRDAVYYGTDSQYLQNSLFRIDRRTGVRNQLGQLSGPVFYSSRLADEQFFGVTAEMCPSQTDRTARLMRLTADERLEEVARFTKDSYHKTWFMLGLLHFPSGPGDHEHLLVHGVALRGVDNRTFALRRNAKESTETRNTTRKAA